MILHLQETTFVIEAETPQDRSWLYLFLDQQKSATNIQCRQEGQAIFRRFYHKELEGKTINAVKIISL